MKFKLEELGFATLVVLIFILVVLGTSGYQACQLVWAVDEPRTENTELTVTRARYATLETVLHGGHFYTITTYGANGVSVTHSPSCPCFMKAEK